MVGPESNFEEKLGLCLGLGSDCTAASLPFFRNLGRNQAPFRTKFRPNLGHIWTIF